MWSKYRCRKKSFPLKYWVFFFLKRDLLCMEFLCAIIHRCRTDLIEYSSQPYSQPFFANDIVACKVMVRNMKVLIFHYYTIVMHIISVEEKRLLLKLLWFFINLIKILLCKMSLNICIWKSNFRNDSTAKDACFKFQ